MYHLQDRISRVIMVSYYISILTLILTGIHQPPIPSNMPTQLLILGTGLLLLVLTPVVLCSSRLQINKTDFQVFSVAMLLTISYSFGYLVSSLMKP